MKGGTRISNTNTPRGLLGDVCVVHRLSSGLVKDFMKDSNKCHPKKRQMQGEQGRRAFLDCAAKKGYIFPGVVKKPSYFRLKGRYVGFL